MSSSSSRRRKASVAGIGYTNAVYFPSSKIYQGATPGMMNYKCINHVYYAFANVGPDGSVFVRSSYLVLSQPTPVPCLLYEHESSPKIFFTKLTRTD